MPAICVLQLKNENVKDNGQKMVRSERNSHSKPEVGNASIDNQILCNTKRTYRRILFYSIASSGICGNKTIHYLFLFLRILVSVRCMVTAIPFFSLTGK